MRLSSPKQITWWIALVLTVISVIMELGIRIPVIHRYSFALIAIAAVLLLIASRIKAL
jgi:hypothetical protein